MNKTTLLRLAKYALVALTAALWAAEAGECTASMRGISPALNAVLDLLTGISSVALIAMICTRHIVQAQEKKTTALAGVVMAATGCEIPAGGDSGPHRTVRLISDRDSA